MVQEAEPPFLLLLQLLTLLLLGLLLTKKKSCDGIIFLSIHLYSNFWTLLLLLLLFVFCVFRNFCVCSSKSLESFVVLTQENNNH